MKRRLSERGQASIVLILAVPALLFVALVIISVAGDGVVKRTETSTAADAAALGAAEEWRTYVARIVERADGADVDVALDRLRPLLTTDVALLNQGPVAARARELAAANGAQVTRLNVHRTARGLEFSVDTRNIDTVAHTATRAEADASAVVDLTGGACWVGSRLGLEYDGHCLAWADLEDALAPEPPPPPADDDDDDDDPEPSPTPTPTPNASLAAFRAEIRLVA